MTDEAWNLLRESTAAGETTGALEHDLDTDHPDGEIEAVSGGLFCRMAHHGNVNTVAACSGQYFSHANARRLVAVWNACLGIADPSAVPDLLAALQALLAEVERMRVPQTTQDAAWQVTGFVRPVEAARAAIAKATTSKDTP